jgi:hypothetical protein
MASIYTFNSLAKGQPLSEPAIGTYTANLLIDISGGARSSTSWVALFMVIQKKSFLMISRAIKNYKVK